MSHRKDTDYLSISARIRAMENRLLTRERMDRMIEAREAMGKPNQHKTADEVFRRWMEDENLDGQMDIFGGEVGGPNRQA